MKTYFCLFFGIVMLVSCAKEDRLILNEPELPDTPYSYFAHEDKATLGRVLFYDKTLSINNSISCGSCHKQQFAFADNTVFSTGVNITPTLRNSMALSNLGNGGPYFWDGRENNLGSLVFGPITNHIEMGITNVDELVSTVSNLPYYQELFYNAYGSGVSISEVTISDAIKSFLVSLRSFNSKFDRSKQGEILLSANEEFGRELFFGKAQCSQCHTGSNLGGGMQANIGLDLNYTDNGMGTLFNDESFNGVFKTPSLRNIAVTAPYMHDGRFTSLEEVVNHYNEGIQSHPNLNWRLTDEILNGDPNNPWWIGPEPDNGGIPISLNLSEQEKGDLIAFLETLTDDSFCSDVRFSDPFKQ